jgi:hypothetical protein
MLSSQTSLCCAWVCVRERRVETERPGRNPESPLLRGGSCRGLRQRTGAATVTHARRRRRLTADGLCGARRSMALRAGPGERPSQPKAQLASVCVCGWVCMCVAVLVTHGGVAGRRVRHRHTVGRQWTATGGRRCAAPTLRSSSRGCSTTRLSWSRKVRARVSVCAAALRGPGAGMGWVDAALVVLAHAVEALRSARRRGKGGLGRLILRG